MKIGGGDRAFGTWNFQKYTMLYTLNFTSSNRITFSLKDKTFCP
jgi:hypothetical protein